MLHASTRAAHAHWDSLRRASGLARREAIDPVRMREALADVFLLERADDGEVRFVLAGTRVCAVLGGEVKGTAFAARWDNPELVRASLSHAAAGGVEAGEALMRSRLGTRHLFELVLMPLSRRGIPGAAAMGVLAPAGAGGWDGQPIESIRLVWRRPLEEARRPVGRPTLRLIEGGAG